MGHYYAEMACQKCARVRCVCKKEKRRQSAAKERFKKLSKAIEMVFGKGEKG